MHLMWLLLAALLGPADPDLTGQWVGPLEMTVQVPSKTRGSIPTDVDLQQTNGRLTGTWRSRPPNTSSGTLTGTLTKLDVVFYADADTAPERCQARIVFTGRLTAANIYRLTADRVIPDERPQKECGNWPTDFVWQLQRAH